MNIEKSKKHYKVIFFDWNKTLSNSLFWEQLRDPDHDRHSWDANISSYLFRENRHLISDWMKGRLDSREIVEKISSQYGYSSDILLEDLAESCRSMGFVSDEVLPLIQRLREQGIRCVIATDNMDTFMKYTVPAMGLRKYFDDFLVSSDKGVFKFDFDLENKTIPFFDDYLQSKGLTYSDAMLIDDCTDKSGTYERLGFEILQIFNPDDFVKKLRRL